MAASAKFLQIAPATAILIGNNNEQWKESRGKKAKAGAKFVQPTHSLAKAVRFDSSSAVCYCVSYKNLLHEWSPVLLCIASRGVRWHFLGPSSVGSRWDPNLWIRGATQMWARGSAQMRTRGAPQMPASKFFPTFGPCLQVSLFC